MRGHVPHPDGGVRKRLDADLGAERLGQEPAPAQDRRLLRDAVRRVDQGQALVLRAPRLVVLDVAGDEHVRHAGDAAGDGLGAGARQHGDPQDLPVRVAGVPCGRQAECAGHAGGEVRQSGRCRQRAQPAEPERALLVLHRVQVEGRLLVRMRLEVGGDHAAAQPPREDDLEAQLVHDLVAAGLPSHRGRARAAEERTLPADRPRAVLVLADHAGAGGEERFAHQVDVVLRHEADQLVRIRGGGRQRHGRLQAEHTGHDVGDAAARLVQAGVRGDHGDALARRTQRQARARLVVGEPLQRREDQRVVADDDGAAEAARLVQRGVVNLEGDQHGGPTICVTGPRLRAARSPVGSGPRPHVQLVVRAADLQTDVVPRLRQIERSELVHRGHDLSHVHELSFRPLGHLAAGRADSTRACTLPS